VSTADLSDARGAQVAPVLAPWRSFGGRTAFDGPVATVRCRDDNALVRSVLAEPGRGRVLVVDGAGSLTHALVGDQLGALAVENGWSGVVVHGAVRDVVALAGLALGVLALGSCPRRGAREGVGERDVPLTLGSALVRPGAHLWCDPDGVLVEVTGEPGGEGPPQPAAL
jgi:regulator of ribonuclease activity A